MDANYRIHFFCRNKSRCNLYSNFVETPKLGVFTANASKKWESASLGVIINQYKRICTINTRKINPEFEWQSRFYDHIIRDNKGFDNISEYINTNHERWLEDSLYTTSKTD